MHKQTLKNSPVGPRRPYVRTMRRWWWLKHPVYRLYMLRELTAVAVAVYALGLLAGVVALACGPQAYALWLQVLANPAVLAGHGLVLAMLVFHAWSWFDIMPKTMPPLRVGAWTVPESWITRAGHGAVLIVSALLVALAWCQ